MAAELRWILLGLGAVFLVGLALGSAVSRLILQARWNWVAALGVIEFGVALSALAGPYLLSLLPDTYAAIQSGVPWLQAHPDTSTALLLALALAFLVAQMHSPQVATPARPLSAGSGTSSRMQ